MVDGVFSAAGAGYLPDLSDQQRLDGGSAKIQTQ
jgi:hypothetical protein